MPTSDGWDVAKSDGWDVADAGDGWDVSPPNKQASLYAGKAPGEEPNLPLPGIIGGLKQSLAPAVQATADYLAPEIQDVKSAAAGVQRFAKEKLAPPLEQAAGAVKSGAQQFMQTPVMQDFEQFMSGQDRDPIRQGMANVMEPAAKGVQAAGEWAGRKILGNEPDPSMLRIGAAAAPVAVGHLVGGLATPENAILALSGAGIPEKIAHDAIRYYFAANQASQIPSVIEAVTNAQTPEEKMMALGAAGSAVAGMGLMMMPEGKAVARRFALPGEEAPGLPRVTPEEPLRAQAQPEVLPPEEPIAQPATPAWNVQPTTTGGTLMSRESPVGKSEISVEPKQPVEPPRVQISDTLEEPNVTVEPLKSEPEGRVLNFPTNEVMTTAEKARVLLEHQGEGAGADALRRIAEMSEDEIPEASARNVERAYEALSNSLGEEPLSKTRDQEVAPRADHDITAIRQERASISGKIKDAIARGDTRQYEELKQRRRELDDLLNEPIRQDVPGDNLDALRQQIKAREAEEKRFAGGVAPQGGGESVGAAGANAATDRSGLYQRLIAAKNAFFGNETSKEEKAVNAAERRNFFRHNLNFTAGSNPEIAASLNRSASAGSLAKHHGGRLIETFDRIFKEEGSQGGAEQVVAGLTEQTLRNMEKGFRTWARWAPQVPDADMPTFYEKVKPRLEAVADTLKGTKAEPGSRQDVAKLMKELIKGADQALAERRFPALRDIIQELSEVAADNQGKIDLPPGLLESRAYKRAVAEYKAFAEAYPKELFDEIGGRELPAEFTSPDVPYFSLTTKISDLPTGKPSRFFRKPLAEPKSSRQKMRSGAAEAYDTSLDAFRKNLENFIRNGEYAKAVRLAHESGLAQKVKPFTKAPQTMTDVEGYPGMEFNARVLPRGEIPGKTTLTSIIPEEAWHEWNRLWKFPEKEVGRFGKIIQNPTSQSLILLWDQLNQVGKNLAVATGQNPKGVGKLILSPFYKAFRAASDLSASENAQIVQDMLGDGAIREHGYGEYTFSKEKARAYGATRVSMEAGSKALWHGMTAAFDGPNGLTMRLRLIARQGLKEGNPELYKDWRERMRVDSLMQIYGKMAMSELESKIKGNTVGQTLMPFISGHMGRLRAGAEAFKFKPKTASWAWPAVNFLGASMIQWMVTFRAIKGRWPQPGEDSLYRIDPDDKDKEGVGWRVGNALGWSLGGIAGRTAANMTGLSQVWNRYSESWPNMLGAAITKSVETLTRPVFGSPVQGAGIYGATETGGYVTYNRHDKKFEWAKDYDQHFDNALQRWLYAISAHQLGETAGDIGAAFNLWPERDSGGSAPKHPKPPSPPKPQKRRFQ